MTTLPKALSRLPPREAYDRAYRLRVASQCSVLHKDLPKEQWIKPSEVCTFVCLWVLLDLKGIQDVRYLRPYVAEVAREDEERRVWDTIQVEKKAHH